MDLMMKTERRRRTVANKAVVLTDPYRHLHLRNREENRKAVALDMLEGEGRDFLAQCSTGAEARKPITQVLQGGGQESRAREQS
jgi:hypothetical protein